MIPRDPEPPRPWPHPACAGEALLLRDCDERRTKGSGPGGQHRNKVETKVVLVHRPSGTAAQAGERRSQGENRRRAVDRLRRALAVAVRVPGAASRPRSGLWLSRCRGGRISCNPAHADFPALLAEALDVLGDRAWDARAAAEALGCTPTQLVRFAADEPPALVRWNAERAARGLPPLR